MVHLKMYNRFRKKNRKAQQAMAMGAVYRRLESGIVAEQSII